MLKQVTCGIAVTESQTGLENDCLSNDYKGMSKSGFLMVHYGCNLNLDQEEHNLLLQILMKQECKKKRLTDARKTGSRHDAKTIQENPLGHDMI